jgi:hypothetical protein
VRWDTERVGGFDTARERLFTCTCTKGVHKGWDGKRGWGGNILAKNGGGGG